MGRVGEGKLGRMIQDEVTLTIMNRGTCRPFDLFDLVDVVDVVDLVDLVDQSESTHPGPCFIKVLGSPGHGHGHVQSSNKSSL